MRELGAQGPGPSLAEPEVADNEGNDGYKKITFYFTLVSYVAALISIPFVYRYLTGPEVTSDPPITAVLTNRTTQDVKTVPDKQGPPPDMIEFD
jgi:hypothetical protein